MFDHLLTEEQRRVRDEAREFVKTTPRDLILDMDAERVRFPKEWLREAARRRLLGVRHCVRWGGRGLDWVTASAVSEEIGSLSYELACVFGVGADPVCDAILSHGTDAQKERYVAPLLKGELFAAECLTEPRGGSDFFDVKVPKENVVGDINGAYAVFNTMMIPERLGTAAMTLGPARAALDIATHYSSRRKAFGQVINRFQGVSFQVAEGATLLDASRSIVYTTSRAVDDGVDMDRIRRLISETKKFVTESCQKVVHNAMQVVGGIGYTTILPLERIYRDVRLASIWTGTNEVMATIVAHEWYREANQALAARRDRDYFADAAEARAEDEIVYE